MSVRLSIGSGPRACEEELLARLAALGEASRSDPVLLARPIRVLVPSKSLRLHLSDRIAAHAVGDTDTGRAMLGIVVQPLFSLASEILDNAGHAVTGGDETIELLARRFARGEEALREAYDAFEDGLGVAVSSVRDLLDAGFEEDFAPALLERLDEAQLSRDELRRAKALVRVAAEVSQGSGRGPSGRPSAIGGRSTLLAAARDAFEADPKGALPTRHLFIHGFADATGRALDLLEALGRHLPTDVLLDHPPDPLGSGGEDPASRFADRFEERLLGGSGTRRILETRATPPRRSLFRAPGPEAETLEVARQIRTLLDGGARPEEIGVVLRAKETYTVPLRRQLTALGVPFSALGLHGAMDGAGRRVLALAALLQEGEHLPAGRWLDTLEPGNDAPLAVRASLRLGLRVVGAARLGHIAELPRRTKDLRLPLPSRASRERGEDAAAGARPASQALPAEQFRAALELAGRTLEGLAMFPERAPLCEHLEAFTNLRHGVLGWSRDTEHEERVVQAEKALRDGLAEELLSGEEFVHFAARALASVAAPRMGGEGAGVQVLETTAARDRTFSALFLLGWNRGVYPRPVQEDLAFPDGVRRPLLDLLPDLPIKARARLEDRYLFASLLAASPRVTVSWLSSAADGRAMVVSPLVERILVGTAAEEVRVAAAVHGHESATVPSGAAIREERSSLRSATEQAILAGITGGPRALAERLPVALAESDAEASRTDSLAAIRIQLIEAFEAGPRHAERLAPWLGFVGPAGDGDLRPDLHEGSAWVPSVTLVEGIAACPWQTTLTRMLGLGALPDPLAALPSLDRLELGSLVHRVLQEIDEDEVGDEPTQLSEASRREPRKVSWPSPADLEARITKAARRAAGEAGERLPVLARLFAACARPLIENAGALRAQEESDGVLAPEVSGEARVVGRNGAPLHLRFRADRSERIQGRLVLTDYKTGKVPVTGSRLEVIFPKGTRLQAMAYAVAASEEGGPAEGRYLYLKGAPGERFAYEGFCSSDSEFEEQRGVFTGTLEAIQAGLEGGTLFPRLQDQKGAQPDTCKYCDVREACLTDDSTARRTFAAWVEEDPAEQHAGGSAGETLRTLFDLAKRKPKKKAKGS